MFGTDRSTPLRVWVVVPLLACAAAFIGCDSGSSSDTGGMGGTGGTGGMGGSPPLDDTFKAATCVRDITPVTSELASAYENEFGEAAPVNHTDPIYIAGFGNDRQATGYHDRLWARGVVVAGPGGRVAIVAIDVIGYFVNET